MRKSLFVTVLILSVLVAWVLGYLNFPYIDQSHSFWVGLVGGLAIVLLTFAITKYRDRKYHQGRKTPKMRLMVPIVLTLLLISVLFLFFKNQSLKSELGILNKQISNINSLSSSDEVKFLGVMNSLLDTAGNELKSSNNNTLSTSVIGRIVALSNSIESYQFIATDTGILKKYSPVKGQLLLGLVHMNMDSSSFTQIKRQVSFAGADLSNSNLSGFDLKGINLKEANFTGASLKGTNLSNSNLFGANFYKAHLEEINLSHSMLKRANLNWSNLSDAILVGANLEKGNLANATLSATDFRGAILNEAILSSAILHQADLTGCKFNQASLIAANLSDAILVNVSMRSANLVNVNLKNTLVDSTWLEDLEKWNVYGKDDLVRRYDLSFEHAQNSWRLLEKE